MASKIQKQLKELYDEVTKQGGHILIAYAPPGTSELSVVARLPQGAPARMGSACTLLTTGMTVHAGDSIIGDRDNIKVERIK
jgi:hypothetical protein